MISRTQESEVTRIKLNCTVVCFPFCQHDLRCYLVYLLFQTGSVLMRKMISFLNEEKHSNAFTLQTNV